MTILGVGIGLSMWPIQWCITAPQCQSKWMENEWKSCHRNHALPSVYYLIPRTTSPWELSYVIGKLVLCHWIICKSIVFVLSFHQRMMILGVDIGLPMSQLQWHVTTPQSRSKWNGNLVIGIMHCLQCDVNFPRTTSPWQLSYITR